MGGSFDDYLYLCKDFKSVNFSLRVIDLISHSRFNAVLLSFACS
ncbi:hypothetical protein [uncultured Gammaproteobacteria bacterium]|nr:hypothetical protein [uncultured Gammaproteobacteria bacterium]